MLEYRNEQEQINCGCTGDEDCCTEPLSGRAENQRNNSAWKTIAFIVIVALAIGVMAHSLFAGEQNSTFATDELATAGIAPRDEVNSANPGRDNAFIPINRIDRAVSNNDFSFVILPAENDASHEKLKTQINDAIDVLAEAGSKLGTFVLTRDSRDFDQICEGLGVKEFPSVFLMNKGGNAFLVDGEVTLNKLLITYIEGLDSYKAGSGASSGGCGSSQQGPGGQNSPPGGSGSCCP